MLTLAIETSNPSAAPDASGVALVRGQALLVREPLRANQRHDDALMPAIDRLCRSAGVEASELERVAVSIGPGGYTSLRIACATAKMICEVTGAQCVGVPSAAVLAVNIPQRPLVVALAYKRDTVWVHRWGRDDGVAGGQAKLERFDEIVGTLGAETVLVAEQAIVDLLIQHGAVASGSRIEGPQFDAVALARAAEGFTPIPPEQLAPLYGREPEAVTKWRALHGTRA